MRAGQRNGRSAEMFVANDLRAHDWRYVFHLAPWEPADLIALRPYGVREWQLVEVKSSTASRERYTPLSAPETALRERIGELRHAVYHVRREGSSAPWFVRSVV